MAASSNKEEKMKRVSHQQASQLLHNKFVVVLGDSIQRSVYKDLVLLLQKDKYLSATQLKSKGEMSFEQDSLVEGGRLGEMHNGTGYREVRQFQSDHHLVRFYFLTRVYSPYMQGILEDFRKGLKPDVIIVNCCLWDISRYDSNWHDSYKENLHKFFNELSMTVPDETLVIWTLTMPVGERIKGGFLVSEVEHKAPQMRNDVIEANFLSRTLADAYGMDVLDLHFQFLFSLQHHVKDGIHWNAIAHRRITFLLLEHMAQAWGVIMPCAPTAVEHCEDSARQPANENASRPAEHCEDSARQPANENASRPAEHCEDSARQPANENASRPAEHCEDSARQPANENASRPAGTRRTLRASKYCSPPPPKMDPQPSEGHYSGYREEHLSDAWVYDNLHYENNQQPDEIPPPHFRDGYGADVGFDDRPRHESERHQQNMMRRQRTRHHNAPYTTHHRRRHHDAPYTTHHRRRHHNAPYTTHHRRRHHNAPYTTHHRRRHHDAPYTTHHRR